MNIRPRTWPLGIKLVVASLIVEVVMLSAMLYSNSRVMTDYLAGQLSTRLEEERQLLNAALAVPLVQRDLGALADVLAALNRSRGIEYLVLTDRQGRTLASSGWPEGAALPPVLPDPPAPSAGRYDTDLAITLAGQTYGTLHFGVSTAFFFEAQHSMLRTGLLIAAAEIGLSAAVLGLIGFWLTRRLHAVTSTIERMAVGGLRARVDVRPGNDEIARLGRSFNTMAAALESHVRELSESQAQFAALARASPVCIFRTDALGGCDYVNEKWCEISGMAWEAAMGDGWLAALHSDERDAVTCQWRDDVANVRPFFQEFRFQRPDGMVTWGLGMAEPLRGEEEDIIGYVGTITDITRRKMAEETLKRTVEALTTSNAELERFAYIASHDLQEPLRTVVRYSQLIEQRYGNRLDFDAIEFIGYIVGASKQMAEMVQGLLEFSRVASAVQHFEAVDTEWALTAALNNLASAIAESGAQIVHENLATVAGHDIQVVQLFQNLIGNGIKYRSPERPPRIAIACHREGNFWRFSVSDNGIGIDPAYIDQLFIIFRRLHTRQAYPGAGIGLALCKGIIEHHGGRIWVESQFGRGSTFFFTLPVLDEAAL